MARTETEKKGSRINGSRGGNSRLIQTDLALAEHLIDSSAQLVKDANGIFDVARRLRAIEEKWPKAVQRAPLDEAFSTFVDEVPALMEAFRGWMWDAQADLDALFLRPPSPHARKRTR